MIRVLYFNHSSGYGGACFSLFRLICALPRSEIEPIVVLPDKGPLNRALEGMGVRVIVDPRICPLMPNTNSSAVWRWSNLQNMTAYFSAVAACRKLSREIRPDVVHINTAVLFHLAKGARQSGVRKIILHVREHWNVKKWDPRGWLARYHLHRFVDCVVAISGAVARQFPVPSCVVTNWPGFDGRDAPIDLEAEYKIDPDRRLILCPGGRVSIKGSLTAVRAMEYVSNCNAVMLVLGAAGGGGSAKRTFRNVLRILRIPTYGLQLDAEIRRLGDRVRSCPATENIRALIERSCIVLSPFTTPHFSMSIIEAAALGRPAIASDNEYSRESMKDGATGLIVPPGDARALAAAINKLLNNPSLCHDYGEAGRRFVAERFSKERSVSKMLQIYGVPDGDRLSGDEKHD